MSPAAVSSPPLHVVAGEAAPVSPLRKFEVTCSNCSMREICLPKGLCNEDSRRVEQLVYARRRLRRGEALFRNGDEFGSIYAIRTGSFKTTALSDDGREQVTGFYMPGELLGMDGIGSGAYEANAVALEDSEVCVLPFANITATRVASAKEPLNAGVPVKVTVTACTRTMPVPTADICVLAPPEMA